LYNKRIINLQMKSLKTRKMVTQYTDLSGVLYWMSHACTVHR